MNRERSDWCALLRELVAQSGGEDEVAMRFCKAAGRQSGTSFHSAKRSLSNWRTGATLPQRKNFQFLTSALKVEEDAERFGNWKLLYAKARDGDTTADRPREHLRNAPAPELEAKQAPPPARWRLPRWPTALAVAGVILGGAGYSMLPAAGHDSRTIGYLPFAELRVGESVLVHAKRGECGEPAPQWREFAHEVPELATGRLVDDGPGFSRSTTCGGVTPGRLVRFEALHAGEETFDLFQRSIKVVVHP